MYFLASQLTVFPLTCRWAMMGFLGIVISTFYTGHAIFFA